MIAATCESASKRVVQWTVLILVVTVTFGQQPRLESVVFYDKYNGEVSLAYEGGYVVIRCSVFGITCTSVELVDESGKEIALSKCENGIATFRLNITKSTNFGVYSCQYTDKATQSSQKEVALKYQYRTCAKDESTEPCWENTFCIVTKGKVDECAEKLDRQLCDQHSPRVRYVCTGNEQRDSLCHAIARDEYATAVVEQDSSCSFGGVDTLPRVVYGEKAKQNEPIEVTSDKPGVDIFCPRDTVAFGADVTVTLTGSDGTEVPVGKNHTSSCETSHTVDLTADIFNRSDIFKLEVIFKKSSPKYGARVLVYLITTGGNVDCTTRKSGNVTLMINCSIVPSPLPGFTTKFTIIPPSGDANRHEGSSLQPHETGDYKVEATVEFESFSPYKFVEGEPLKRTVVVAAVLPITGAVTKAVDPSMSTGAAITLSQAITVNQTNKPTNPEKQRTIQDWAMIGVIVAVAVALLIVAAVVVIFLVKRRRRRKSRRVTRSGSKIAGSQDSSDEQKTNAELEKLADDPKAALNLAKLENWSKEWLTNYASLTMGVGPGMADFEATAYKEERNVAKQVVKGARYNDEVRLDTQFVLEKRLPLSIAVTKVGKTFNVITDYNGNPILLGQAPTKDETYEHWQMIFQANIGTIVWVGNLNELTWMGRRKGRQDVEKIYPYAPIVKGQSVKPLLGDQKTYGQFEIMAANVIPNEHGCDTVFLDVMRKRASESSRREITLIHIKNWPDRDLPKDLPGLARAIDHIADQQEYRETKGLPGILIHCSAGRQRSVAVVAAYIGRQMWINKGVVNPLGILQYIRRKRYKALKLEPDLVNVQVAIFAGVLQAVCTRISNATAGKVKAMLDDHSGIFAPLLGGSAPEERGQTPTPAKSLLAAKSMSGAKARNVVSCQLRPKADSAAASANAKR